MTTIPHKALPEPTPASRSMVMSVPNQRRTSPRHEIKTLQEGRKRQKLSHSPEKDSTVAVLASSVAHGTPHPVKSQDSSSTDQSASKWFMEANRNSATNRPQTSELDDDPPFYMTNQPSYIPDNFVSSDSNHRFGGLPQSRLDSENEDLRAVIDDLTVENKRLKQMMRLQSRQRPSIPSDDSPRHDKLFEVRMHGLPKDKRRELENLLKSFATSVHSSVPNKGACSLTASNSMNSTNTFHFMGNKGSQADSGYASNSNTNSGPASGGQLSQSNTPHLPISNKPPSTSKAVKSYLQEIPDTLLPKHNPIMSERAKSALVVRRLEQLFTGRRAAPGDHDQPMQQQEISQSAARADRLTDPVSSKKRKAEGPREAHVMPPDSKVNLDAINHLDTKESVLPPKVRNMVASQDSSTGSRLGSPDQRPTRPLDLDVHRAQVAAENIQYLQHLGMPFPQLSDASQETGENWVYLNLLAGLAQLHTLNVTPDFIRRAVKKVSKKFELSKDGHKVRWVGGLDETKFMAEDEKVIEVVAMSPQELTEDSGNGGGSSKRSKSYSTSNAAMTSNTPSEDKTSGLQTTSDTKMQQHTTSDTSYMQSSNVTKPTTSTSAFDYKPIVYRGKPLFEYEESYLRDSDDSFDSQSGDSSGLVHALTKSNLHHRAKDEGSLTFYDNPYFFSDLSSEQEPSNMQARPRAAIVGETLGLALPDVEPESPLRFSDATYFATEFAPRPFEARDEDQAKLNIKLPRLEPIDEAGEYESVPIEFKVAGLGGVTPEDNFALDVKIERNLAPSKGNGVVLKQMPFSGRRYRLRYLSEITSCHKIQLLPSRLPAPSYIFFTSSSSSDALDLDDDISDDSSDTSSPLVDEVYPAPPAFLQRFSKSSSEDGAADMADGTESSEIDILAIARRQNPEQIAEQERVYMINEPGGAIRAVAGSLAATVGGSSIHEEAGVADISSVGSEHGSQEDEGMNDD